MNSALKHLYLSSISDGEPVAGFIHRSQFGFSRSLQRELRNAIGIPYSGKFSWLLPSRLNLISEIFGDATADANSMLEKNTLFPAFSRFISQKNRDTLEKHHRFDSVNGIGTKLSLHRLNQSGRVFGVCNKCLNEDISSDGRSFWRREFMMPSIDFCWKHGEPLQVGCTTCILDFGKPESILYSGKNCVCKINRNFRLSSYTNDDVRSMVDLSFGFSRLLDPTTLQNVKFDDLRSAITIRASSLGLTKNGRVYRTRVIEFLDANKLVSSQGKRLIFGISWNMMIHALSGKQLPTNPISSIRLLSVLFGGWPEVENQLMNTSSFLSASNNSRLAFEVPSSELKGARRQRKSKPIVVREDYFLECVNAYRIVRDDFPHETHSELVRRLPSAFQLILTRQRLMSIGERIPVTNSGEEYYKLLDSSLEKHIRHNKSMLQSTRYSQRVSANVLLRGHSMVSVWARIKASLPLSRRALEECEETYPVYRKRQLMKLVVDTEESEVQTEIVNAIGAFDDSEVVRLLGIARKKKRLSSIRQRKSEHQPSHVQQFLINSILR